MVEFVRRVIEYGSTFDKHHFAIMMMNLEPAHLTTTDLPQFIKIIA